MNKLFQELGFTDTEAQVYETLLSHPPLSVADIQDKSALPRSSIVAALQYFSDEGIVKFSVTGKRKRYYVHTPEALLNLAETYRNRAHQQEALVRQHLPRLRSLHFIEQHESIQVDHLKGEEGFKELFMMTLQQPKHGEILRLGVRNEKFNVARDYLHNVYVPQKIQKGIVTRLLLEESNNAKEVRSRDAESLRETRFITKNFFDPLCYVQIWEDHVSYTVWDDGLHSVVITSASVAATMRQMFELMWSNAQ